jgi:hypothetical protein
VERPSLRFVQGNRPDGPLGSAVPVDVSVHGDGDGDASGWFWVGFVMSMVLFGMGRVCRAGCCSVRAVRSGGVIG